MLYLYGVFMHKFLFFLIFFLSITILSCTDDPVKEDLSGQLNEKCRTDQTCDAGLACKDSICVNQEDACNRVTCLSHGTCIVENSKAVCDCDSGFIREDDIKCVPSSACNDVNCSNHGTCEDLNGAPNCICDSGYSTDATGERCLENLDPCANITCGGEERGTCQSSNGILECICESGYHAQGLNCISDDNPCEGVECSNHGICEVDGTSALCNCDTGFISSGLECIDETTNPCKDQTCSGFGECQIYNDEATCICNQGYIPGEGLTCLSDGTEENACLDVACLGEDGLSHGQCHEDDDGNPVCFCDNGYFRAGYMCLEDMGSPCYGETCSDHGICKVDNFDEPYCECSDNYFSGDNLTCINESVVCNGISCSNHGTCIANTDGSPTCDCDESFVAVGTECVSNPCEPNPCEGVANTNSSNTCIAHSNNSFSCECAIGYFWNTTTSTCDENSCPNNHMHPSGNTCVCDEGYEPDGEYCVLIGSACDSNPCAGYENTQCLIDDNSIDGYTCSCKDGYDYDQFNNCVAVACADSPCEDNIDDVNRTKCVADGDTYTCECANGYVDNNGICESSTNNACDSNPCVGVANSTEECIAGPAVLPDLYMCTCNDTYGWDFISDPPVCISCDSCDGIDNANGNCEIGFDGTPVCECNDGYDYMIDDNGNGSCELNIVP
jgi:hypothetical protein